MNTLRVGDAVNVTIIENGYWKDSVMGRIVRETDKFWIIKSSSHRFWNSDKRAQTERRFAKASGCVTKRG